MNDSLTIFVNTHSSAGDCWVMFFRQLRKHWPSHPPVVIACDRTILWGQKCFVYQGIEKFSNQYLAGLCFVETDFVLPLQEDFLLYADVDEAAIGKEIPMGYPCSRLIDSGRQLDYSMQATIWNTTHLKELYAAADAATPWEAEVEVNRLMDIQEMYGKQRRDDKLPLRGRDHRDSPIFPYIATALIKGKWNSEYRTELEPLHKEYGIDAAQRGWSA